MKLLFDAFARASARARARARALALPAAALLLAACASTPPSPPTVGPLAAAPAAWLAPRPEGCAAALAAGPGFGDALLPPLVRAAQAASPSLSAAAVQLARARANRVAASAAQEPTVGVVASAAQGRQALNSPTGAQASLGLQASWEIDLFGANAAGRVAAQARLEGAAAALQAAQVAVAAEVASTYTALRSCEARSVPTQADADSRAETARLTDLSAQAGFTAPADAALVRAGAAQARSAAVVQRARCDTLWKSLAELTDTPEPALRQRLAAQSGQVPVPVALSVPAVPAELLARRPDVAEAARQVLAAAGDRDQAQAREKPQITLNGSIAGVALQTRGESFSGATWSLGPLSVNFPLFDGGARKAASAAAQAAYEGAVLGYRAQVRRAVREVEAGLVALRSVEDREADAQQATRDFEASLRATQARQRGGLASLFDLEAARRNALLAQGALIDLQAERAEAWIALYRALGGGFDAAGLADAGRP